MTRNWNPETKMYDGPAHTFKERPLDSTASKWDVSSRRHPHESLVRRRDGSSGARPNQKQIESKAHPMREAFDQDQDDALNGRERYNGQETGRTVPIWDDYVRLHKISPDEF